MSLGGHPCARPPPPFSLSAYTMVIASHLAWVVSQLEKRRQLRMRMSTYTEGAMVHIALLPEVIASLQSQGTIAWFGTRSNFLDRVLAVDYGHRTSKLESMISIS